MAMGEHTYDEYVISQRSETKTILELISSKRINCRYQLHINTIAQGGVVLQLVCRYLCGVGCHGQ